MKQNLFLIVYSNVTQKWNYVTYHQTTSIYLQKDLQIMLSNASALNGIFTTHQIKNDNGHTDMWPYSSSADTLVSTKLVAVVTNVKKMILKLNLAVQYHRKELNLLDMTMALFQKIQF